MAERVIHATTLYEWKCCICDQWQPLGLTTHRHLQRPQIKLSDLLCDAPDLPALPPTVEDRLSKGSLVRVRSLYGFNGRRPIYKITDSFRYGDAADFFRDRFRELGLEPPDEGST